MLSKNWVSFIEVNQDPLRKESIPELKGEIIISNFHKKVSIDLGGRILLFDGIELQIAVQNALAASHTED